MARTRPTWNTFSVRRSNGVGFGIRRNNGPGLDDRVAVTELFNEAARQRVPADANVPTQQFMLWVNWRHAGEESVTRCVA